MTNEREQYTMGYGPAATAIIAMRTAQSHAAFFLAQVRKPSLEQFLPQPGVKQSPGEWSRANQY
jgi:hypothetical protein